MSTLNHLFDLPDQICYVQCGFCTTILLVSVPCSSLSTVVTVICGHCTSLFSVNMKKFSFLPFNLSTSLSNEDEQKEQLRPEVNAQKGLEMQNSFMAISFNNDEDDRNINQVNRVINKPPEKRQRGPSAYNRFIREEIRRIKTENPRIAHKEAFSTAAKNWAHSPLVHCEYTVGESSGLEEENGSWSCDAADQF
ncbi:PREDICTED: axial regulator YABBY 4-like isoform X2 [Populus euphratica]|uniref:Axial regulator YABBY 4-like isoform X2 n=1 Tax=Populus euphratica TaxID=75702 RepID=A0AAJ6UR69_POPEU|nr:PREDICTED: axial regulator YABBY 4-like isoform X2 [Populus euphratica]